MNIFNFLLVEKSSKFSIDSFALSSSSFCSQLKFYLQKKEFLILDSLKLGKHTHTHIKNFRLRAVLLITLSTIDAKLEQINSNTN